MYVTSININEVILIARLLWSEARGENRAGQIMVAQSVLDRVKNGKWGHTISTVIYSKGQYAVPSKLDENLFSIALSVLNGERFKKDKIILFFRVTKSKSNWYAPYIGHIGKHAYYGYERK
jgi:spore germination cell wall hydrolase CwlJ-like protein